MRIEERFSYSPNIVVYDHMTHTAYNTVPTLLYPTHPYT